MRAFELIYFDQAYLIYEDTIKNIISPNEWHKLLTDEQLFLKKLANKVFDKLIPLSEIFIGICLGINKGFELGHSGIEKGLCAVERLFNKKSINEFKDPDKNFIVNMVENTFFLGFISYLMLYQFPTRSSISNINLNELSIKWSVDTLMADRIMSNFNDKLLTWLKAIFTIYYTKNIQPLLKNHFKFGFWKMGKCDSYFTNLFYSGSLLALMADIETKKYA